MMAVLNVMTGIAYVTLSAAISASHANDVLQMTPGKYVENFPNITHSLTIESLDGLAALSTPQPVPMNGRTVLYVPRDLNVSLTLSGLAISGAVDPGGNGAAIGFETGNADLTVSRSHIFGNQDGILTGAVDKMDPGGMHITIVGCEVDHNGNVADNPMFGYVHNIYVGAATELTVTGSYIHDALGGHEIKTRAATNVIADNRIVDGPTAPASYDIDLPNGGDDLVLGNVIEKGPRAENPHVVDFGAEGNYPRSSLTIAGNTIVNDRREAVLLLNDTKDASGATIPARIVGNVLYGMGAGSKDTHVPPGDIFSDNRTPEGGAPRLDKSQPFSFSHAAPKR